MVKKKVSAKMVSLAQDKPYHQPIENHQENDSVLQRGWKHATAWTEIQKLNRHILTNGSVSKILLREAYSE